MTIGIAKMRSFINMFVSLPCLKVENYKRQYLRSRVRAKLDHIGQRFVMYPT